jgi:hypothetical protein
MLQVGAIYPFIHLSMNTYFSDSDLDKKFMMKYGHPYEKPFREEDVNAYVFPERDDLCGKGMLLYNRYHASGDKTHCWLSKCDCNHYGKLCGHCRILNTSDFYGLEVPLCPEDMTLLSQKLIAEGWKAPQIYQWLHFWIQEHNKFLNYKVCKFVFWRYDKFSIFGMGGSVHKFFRYLFSFVMKGKHHGDIYVPYQRNDGSKPKPSFLPDGPHSAKVNTGDAALQLSLKIYARGDEIKDMETVEMGKKNHKLPYTKVSWGIIMHEVSK